MADAQRLGEGGGTANAEVLAALRAQVRRIESTPAAEQEGVPGDGPSPSAGARRGAEMSPGERFGTGSGGSKRRRGGRRPAAERGREETSGAGERAGRGEFSHDGASDHAQGQEDPPGEDAPGDPEAVARSIVLRRLTARAHTRRELERALARKQVPAQAARSVLDRMQEVGLVDDAAFAEAWVESRQQRRHLSRTALRRELTRKGVEAEQVDQALATVDPEDEHTAALDLARRKARTMGGLDAITVRRRLAGALGRRGFGPGLARRVVDEVLDELDRPDDEYR